MGVENIAGSFGFAAFDFGSIVDKIYIFVGIFLLAVILGSVIFFLFYIRAKNKTSRGNNKIGWWEEIGDKLEPGLMEDVEELVIPGTTLRIFYGKKRDIWLPRFSRAISKGLYYVTITKTGQIVNFELQGLSKDMKAANLDYDHTDMLWAAENAREFIKKNYKDKAKKWWDVYSGAITTAIFIFIMTFSLVIIIFFMRGMVQDLQPVANAFKEAAQIIAENKCNAGLIPA